MNSSTKDCDLNLSADDSVLIEIQNRLRHLLFITQRSLSFYNNAMPIPPSRSLHPAEIVILLPDMCTFTHLRAKLFALPFLAASQNI
jgi:hypothetical protein